MRKRGSLFREFLFRLKWAWKYRSYPEPVRPHCLDCRKPLMEFGKLCPECMGKIDLLPGTPPQFS